MSGSHWSDSHVEWLRVKFDELARMPIYLRTANELPSIVQPGNSLAWTHPSLDVRLRPILDPRGQWSGRGIAVVVEDAAAFFSLSHREQAGIVLHELAHCFETSDSPQRRRDFVWTDHDEWLTQPGNIDRVCSRLKIEPITDAETSRTNHGAAFTRAALHCWWRCRHEITLHSMNVFWEKYGSPDVGQAIAALDRELRTTGNILETLRTPAPEGFTELWKADTRSE